MYCVLFSGFKCADFLCLFLFVCLLLVLFLILGLLSIYMKITMVVKSKRHTLLD